MEATGMVRKIDTLGRIALPAQLRKKLNIKAKDALEIFVEGESIILQEFRPACVFCGNVGSVSEFKGKLVCKKCIKNISGL